MCRMQNMDSSAGWAEPTVRLVQGEGCDAGGGSRGMVTFDRKDAFGEVQCDNGCGYYVEIDLYSDAELSDPDSLVLCERCIEQELLEQDMNREKEDWT